MLKPFVTLVLFAAAALAAPPTLRLPEDVRPVSYRLDLTLIPDQDTFTGAVDIDLDVQKPANTIWLNSRGLTLDEATLTVAGHPQAATIEPGGQDFAGFALPAAIPAGRARLRIAYHGNFNTKGTGGLFKMKDGDNWYIYTQFEAIDARHAFPCFDEPNYKVPWQLTLHVKKDHAAVSNTPILSESGEDGGRKKVVFGETKPLPSYLIAFAVGPFEFVDAGHAGKKDTPLRVITPKGKTAQAKYAAETIGPLLTLLENYFGMPFPYEKLDALAIPLFPGAMENAGLITYGQTLLLGDPAHDTIDRQRGFVEVAAHEMAHQWFGDLVTTAWWNDIWLNEAFASWMSSKIVRQFKPEWNTQIDEQNIRLGAMENDSLVSARKIRQPIESNDDIANAFDNITYSKGEAVIRMFEDYMGADAFQRGVQHYVRQYSWRNATAGDFLDSVGSAGGRPISRPFATFLDQPGAPLVSFALHCDTGGDPALELSQKRALPLGSTGSTAESWQVPVCIRYAEGAGTHRECSLLTQASQEWKLPAKSCPAWLLANADGNGYYRARYEGDLLPGLLAHASSLSAGERVALLGDVESLTRMGEFKAADALALAPQFADDPVRQVVGSVIGIAGTVRVNLLTLDLLPNYGRFIEKTFGPRAHQLGWLPKPGDDSESRLLRSSIVPQVAVFDHELAAEARQLSERWLADHNSIDPDIADAVLNTAARTGDEAYFKQLLAALHTTEDQHQRSLIFGALGSFRDPAIARQSLDLLLKPEFDLREATALLAGPLSTLTARRLPFEFVEKHYDALIAKLPTEEAFNLGGFLPFVGSVFCDDKSSEEVSAFFEPKVARFAGTRRNLDQTLESIRLCTAFKAAQGPSVAEFLRKY